MFAKVVSRSAGRARFLFVARERADAARSACSSVAPARCSRRRTATSCHGSRRRPRRRSSIACCRSRGSRQIPRSPTRSCRASRCGGRRARRRSPDRRHGDARSPDHVARRRWQKLGGPTELEAAWLHAACAATGNERSALRLCAELAVGRAGAAAGRAGRAPDQPRPGVRAARVRRARAARRRRPWRRRGHHVDAAPRGPHPARPRAHRARRAPRPATRSSCSARRPRRRAGSRWASCASSTSEGISPVTPAELADRRAVEALLHDGRRRDRRGADRDPDHDLHLAARPGVLRSRSARRWRSGLVRGGRAGLSAFGWLPGSGYGKVIADTGLTRAMVAPEAWKKIERPRPRRRSRRLGRTASRRSWRRSSRAWSTTRRPATRRHSPSCARRPRIPRTSPSCSPHSGRSRAARRPRSSCRGRDARCRSPRCSARRSRSRARPRSGTPTSTSARWSRR